MKFLKITDSLSVRKDEIIAVERRPDFGCFVLTQGRLFESDFPFETILQLLETPELEESMSRSMTLAQVYNNPMQFWAG